MTTYTTRVCLLVRQLQQELGVAIECGQLTLNLNQGVLASHDVHAHYRGQPEDGEKEVDRPRRTA